MKLCPVAGCIVAGNTLMADPLRELGAISVARRAVIALKQAGVFPVAVVSDASDDELRYRLASQGLVFLRQPDPKAQLFSSIRVGLEYLADKCERVVVAPVNSPLFAPSTVMALARSSADAAVPEYHGRRGHRCW